jgi:RNA polymerase sigma-70 factor (ECF subfamily)
MDGAGKPLETATESALIDRTLRGDGEAFNELVRPCQRNLFLTALSILENEADAQEVAQEAVLKAFRKLSGFRQESSFRTWLTRIAVNEARMRVRKDRRYHVESLDELYQDDGGYTPKDIPDVRELPLQAVERKHVRKVIAKALVCLPSKSREVVVLRDIEHFSIAETTRILGVSESCVKTRLLRGRRRLRVALAPMLREPPGSVATSVKRGNMKTGLKLAILILLLTSGAQAQELFAIRNSKNQKVPFAEADNVYLSACSVVKREFGLTTMVRPQLTLVLGASTNRVYYDKREVQLAKWDKHMFVQGVVILAVEDLLNPSERLRLGELAVTWADATLDVGESRNKRTQEQVAK